MELFFCLFFFGLDSAFKPGALQSLLSLNSSGSGCGEKGLCGNTRGSFHGFPCAGLMTLSKYGVSL